MQQSQGVSAHTDLKQHEPHLRAGGPRQGMLDGVLRHHGQDRNDRCHTTEDQQHHMAGRKAVKHGEQAQPEEPPKVDYTGVKQRRYRRRRFHYADKPTVKRNLGALEYCRQGQNNRCHSQGSGSAITGGLCLNHFRQVKGAVVKIQGHHTGDDQCIAYPTDNKLLHCRHTGLGAVLVEGQQMMQGQTDTNPGARKNQQVVGEYQDQDRGNGDQKPGKKPVAAGILSEIVVRKPQYHPTDKGHHERHPDCNAIRVETVSTPQVRQGVTVSANAGLQQQQYAHHQGRSHRGHQ